LMAADEIDMPEDAFIMMHNGHGGVMGDAEEMRGIVDVIDKLQDSIVSIYEKRTGLDADTIRDMMAVETWMNATDALKNGFIDRITDAVDVAAKIGVFYRYFNTMPVEAHSGAEEITNAKEFEKCLRDSGLSRRLASALTSRAKSVFKVDPIDTIDPLLKLSAALDRVKIPKQINENP